MSTRREPTHREIAKLAYGVWQLLEFRACAIAEDAVMIWLSAERYLREKGRQMADPLQWSCGYCDAQPHEPCVGPFITAEVPFHAERVECAEAHTCDGAEDQTPDKPEFDQAVDESGLV